MGHMTSFLLVLLSFCPQTSQTIDYRTMKIEDDSLLTEFKKADNCVKVEIIEFFKKDLSPTSRGHGNELIRQMEDITKTKASRDGTYIGYIYKSVDFDNDVNNWTKILNCKN